MRTPEEAALEGDLSNEVERALAPLSDREKEVLRLRYGLGTDREYTLEEIGRRLSVTRERVRQIESRALAEGPRGEERPGRAQARLSICDWRFVIGDWPLRLNHEPQITNHKSLITNR